MKAWKNDIVQETVRCKRIIQESLLDFSRERPPQKKMADLNSVMEKSLSILDNEFLTPSYSDGEGPFPRPPPGFFGRESDPTGLYESPDQCR